MAIIIKEEGKKRNLFTIVTTLLFVVLTSVVIYYLFFIKPPLIDVIIPLNVQSLNELSQIEFNPQKVFSHPVYNTLQQTVSSLSVSTTTIRENPFMP